MAVFGVHDSYSTGIANKLEFHTKWDGASYDVGHALSHQVGQLFTASALFTIN